MSMNAKETIKYLYEHGYIPQTIHFETIVAEINKITAERDGYKAALERIKELPRHRPVPGGGWMDPDVDGCWLHRLVIEEIINKTLQGIRKDTEKQQKE